MQQYGAAVFATRMAYRWEYQRLTRRNTTEGVLRCMPLSEGYRSILSTVIAWDQRQRHAPAVPGCTFELRRYSRRIRRQWRDQQRRRGLPLKPPFPGSFPSAGAFFTSAGLARQTMSRRCSCSRFDLGATSSQVSRVRPRTRANSGAGHRSRHRRRFTPHGPMLYQLPKTGLSSCMVRRRFRGARTQVRQAHSPSLENVLRIRTVSRKRGVLIVDERKRWTQKQSPHCELSGSNR